MTGQSAAVEPEHPPTAILRVTNPVVRLLLRSRLGGPMRRQLMVLRFTGRKTRRRYDIPVTAHRLDGKLYSLTYARWRNNFCGGVPVEVTPDGHVTPMQGQLLDDPERVAPIYARSISHLGVKRAQRMIGVKIHTPGTPSDEALVEAAKRYHLCAIQFTEAECPTVIPTVLAYTAEVAAARPWGIVTGNGRTPEDALKTLRDKAGKQGQQIFPLLWKHGSGPKSQWQKKMAALRTEVNKGARLKGTFTVGSTRLAYGQKDDEPWWTAYGTLLTDNAGDGFNWLQWESPQEKQDGQTQGPAGQGSGDGSDVK